MLLTISNNSLTADETRRAQLEISPLEGGRISSLEVTGKQLLLGEGSDAIAWGCYPMVPFAGRIDSGILNFDGAVRQLPATMDGHAIHGYGYTSPWKVLHSSETEVELSWTFTEPWPWPGVASQHFVVDTDSFSVTMTVTAEKRQPVSFGWHPWFRRKIAVDSKHDALQLGFIAECMYELDDRKIPTGETIEPTAGPWDNCFAGVEQPIELHWGDTRVSLTSDTDYWVVYTEPNDSICVEPQTGFPNAVNMAPQILESGESTSATFTISW